MSRKSVLALNFQQRVCSATPLSRLHEAETTVTSLYTSHTLFTYVLEMESLVHLTGKFISSQFVEMNSLCVSLTVMRYVSYNKLMNDLYNRITVFSPRISDKIIVIDYNVNNWCIVAYGIHTVRGALR